MYVRFNDRGGMILAPCVFLLGLLTFLAISIQNVGGLDASVAAALAERTQARKAAYSGVEIAYGKLTVDQSYTGESCSPFARSSAAVEITVTDLGDDEYEVLSKGTLNGAESLIRTTARADQAISSFPLCVENNLYMQGPDPQIISDCYVGGGVYSSNGGSIAGNLYLPGDREILYDSQGKPIKIDGNSIPAIGGQIYCNVPPLTFPDVDLTDLRAMAASQGQIYTGNLSWRDVDIYGVVYLEGTGTTLYIKEDVNIYGVLVCDHIDKVHVQKGMLKVSGDENLCAGVAALGPGSLLHINPNGEVDFFGLTLFDEVAFHAMDAFSGMFTGPLIVRGNLATYPHTELYCLCPKSMCNRVYPNLSWGYVVITETAFEEY